MLSFNRSVRYHQLVYRQSQREISRNRFTIKVLYGISGSRSIDDSKFFLVNTIFKKIEKFGFVGTR
jgi:hypothetical protein